MGGVRRALNSGQELFRIIRTVNFLGALKSSAKDPTVHFRLSHENIILIRETRGFKNVQNILNDF